MSFTASLATGLLDKTIADNPLIEILRWICIFLGGSATVGVILMFMTHRDPGGGPKRRAMLIGMAAVGLFCVLQEWAQLGHPMLWWRLPLLIVISAVVTYVVYWPDKEWRTNARS